MNFATEVEKSSSVRDEHKESLIRYLRRVPDFSWLLGAPNRNSDRLQGDFFTEFPVVFTDPTGKVLQSKRTVMVVNNSCDLPAGRSNWVTVAPTFDFARYIEGQKSLRKDEALNNHERDIRQNQISELLFVPNLLGFSDGAIVRFDMMNSVPSVLLQDAVDKGQRIASFTQNGFYVLLTKLIHHIGRIESSDVARN